MGITTGATQQQIEDAAKRIRVSGWGHIPEYSSWDQLSEWQRALWYEPVVKVSPYLVPTTHRIIALDDLICLRNVYDNMGVGNKSILDGIDALIAGDSG